MHYDILGNEEGYGQMDWVTGMQRAIDYMEEHLTDELKYEKIASVAYCSSFHFQRVFGILSGLYIGGIYPQQTAVFGGK